MYNKQKERKSFHCYAWITVSRRQDNDVILRAIIQNIREEHPNPNSSAALLIETADAVSLVNKVRECLKDKRYLIVFDDVWQLSFWNDVKHAVLDSNKRSRVIITTRNEGVADYCRSDTIVYVRKVKPLPPNDALELFRRKAFQQEGYPQELRQLSEDFVRKCNGIPLAIVGIAGLLSTKEKTAIEWRKVYNQLGSLLQSDPSLEIVQHVISESYNDLPSHLKRCLLYFGLFPEDYSISCMRLIRLWVAEGFVKGEESEDITMEEYAKDYLTELSCRSLVQTSREDFDGKPKSCQVHDLVHVFIVKKCEEQSFCQVMKDSITQPTSKLDSVGRRLTINNVSAAMKSAAKWKRVRSCFVFDDAKKWPVTKPFFSSFELLTGLDLSDARLDVLPEEVGELLNLTYLSLRNTNIRSLPKSIGKLENLQTLDLKRTQVHELPEEIKNLIKLRHLLAYFINNQHFGLNSLQGVTLKKGLQNLTSLLKLSFLDANDSSSIIEELKQLRKLRKLGIIKLRAQYGEALCGAIESMTHLCSLSIGAIESNEILKLQSLTNPPESLQRLYLYGRLESFPNWIPKLKNLTRLYLKWSGLKEDPLPHINDLSGLLQLELYDTYAGDELHFKNGWLKGLKVLYIESMPKLKTIKIDRGAIPCLEKMKIGKCHEMVRIPWDVQNLTSLKALHLYDMPDQFIKRIMGPHGEDYRIVNKIPVVVCTYDDHFATLHNLDALNDEFGGNW